MTALLYRLLHDYPHARRIQLPGRVSVSPSPLDTPLTATGERLATRNELATLRSFHPRRIVTGK